MHKHSLLCQVIIDCYNTPKSADDISATYKIPIAQAERLINQGKSIGWLVKKGLKYKCSSK